MRLTSLLFSGLVLMCANTKATEPESPDLTVTDNSQINNSTELAAVNQVIDRLFEAISFESPEQLSMGDLVEVFVEKGLLIDYNNDIPLVLNVDDFIRHFGSLVEEGAMQSLEDREVFASTKIYDRIAHRYSFYEARNTSDDPSPFAVGVNSIQLIKIDGSWKITSMAWNDDNRGSGFFNRVLPALSGDEP